MSLTFFNLILFPLSGVPAAEPNDGSFTFEQTLYSMIKVGSVPQIPGSTLVTPNVIFGLNKQDFLYDMYFRVWVFPDRLELRNPRVGVDIPFDIWNAYPYKNVLTSIDGMGIGGLDLDFSAGIMWREIEYRTVNLQITPAAPLSIEAQFQFHFQQGVGYFTFVADRASVLSILPDVPLSEEWEWLTDVIVATDGTEQRAGLRAVPRRTMSSKLLATTSEEVWANIKKAMFDFGGQVVIPYFQYSTTTTGDVQSGATTIPVNTSKTDLREGEYVFIMTRTSQELARVLVLGAQAIELDAPVGISIAKGSLITPAFPSVVNSPSSIGRYAVNTVAEIRVDSTVSQARRNFKRPGSNVAITSYDGYDVLDKRPLANSNVEENFDQGYERFDYGTGTIEQINRWLFTRMEGPREFLVKRVAVPAELDYWRDFLDNARGRLNPFLVPTFRPDLYVAKVPGDASITLEVVGGDYASLFFPLAPYKRLYLWTDAGPLMVTVSAATLSPEGNSICTLVNAIPSGTKYRNIKFVSFLLKCRLAQDLVSLEHYAMDTILTLSIRTVPE